jgi:hypothetical protein
VPPLFFLGYVDDDCRPETLLEGGFLQMLLSGTYSKTQTIFPGAEITQQDVRSFRAQVGLALAASETVIVDLRCTNRVDSWALLAIWDLSEKFSSRLTFAAPDYLRASITPTGLP